MTSPVPPAAPLVAVPAANLAAAVGRAEAHNRLLGIGLREPLDVQAGSWRGPDADGVAADLIAHVGAWLRTDQRRVAASMVVLGYAARLLGPAVAVLARDGVLLDLSPDRVTFAFTRDQGFQLAVTPPAAGWNGPAWALHERWNADLIDGHLRLVIDAVRRVVPVAAGLLWGNVASGLTGALAALARDGAVPTQQCHTTGLALMAPGPLRHAGELSIHPAEHDNEHDTEHDKEQAGGRDGGHDGEVAQLRFTRRSCCLYYRLPGGGMCADCALAPTARFGPGVAKLD